MPTRQKTVVISDVHMSNGADYSWFLPPYPQDIAALLHKVANDASVEELVFLGDFFDLWLYPIDVVPWSISRIIAANPSITQALQQCTRNLANVYYLTGNHDMSVQAHDLLPFNSGGKSIQLISPEWYRAKYQGRRHLEHGHAVDMFNAPDDSGDTIGGYPLGFFITRLVATATYPGAAGQALKKLLQTHSATVQAMELEAIDGWSKGSGLVLSMITLLAGYAGVKDTTPIRFSEPKLDSRYTVGDIKRYYGSLFGTWLKRYPNPRDLAKTMLVTVDPHGLDWFVKKLLSGETRPKLVVMGHTHNTMSRDEYSNDGCWCHSSLEGSGGMVPSYVEVVQDTARLVFWR